jgi:hypothetical protein
MFLFWLYFSLFFWLVFFFLPHFGSLLFLWLHGTGTHSTPPTPDTHYKLASAQHTFPKLFWHFLVFFTGFGRNTLLVLMTDEARIRLETGASRPLESSQSDGIGVHLGGGAFWLCFGVPELPSALSFIVLSLDTMWF